MSDAREPDEDGADLLGRWLAHREETEEDAPRPRTYGVPRTGLEDHGGQTDHSTDADEPTGAAPTPSRSSTEIHAHASSTHRGTPPRPAPPPTPREPVGLEDFEPVVIASVRRAAEAPEEPARPRLLGGRRRAAAAPEPAPSQDEGPVDEGPTEPEDGTAHEVEELEPVAEVEREDDAEVLEAGEPLAPEPAEAEPTPAPAPAPAPSQPVTQQPVTQKLAPQTAAEAPAPGRRRPAAAYLRRATAVLDRSVRGTPEERVAPPDPVEATPPPRSTTTEEAGPTPSRSAYDELRARREAAVPPRPDVLPPDLDFRPRTAARRITSVLLLVGLAATGLAAWRAYDSRVETDIGLAAILALATGVVWAVRAGTVPTRVSLHGGRLEVRTQAGRFLFELTNEHTRVEMVGTPGRRGWRILVHRRGLAPFEITPAMVDPHELTEALRYYRPDL